MSFTVRFTHMRYMSKRENKYFIPNPSGFSKMIGSLRPLLWMNSYVKSGTKQADNNMVVFSCWTKCQLQAIIKLQVPVATHSCSGMCCYKMSSAVHYLFPPCDWPVQNWTSDCWLSPPGQTSSCHQSLHPRCRRHGNVAAYRSALKWKWSSQFKAPSPDSFFSQIFFLGCLKSYF